MNKFNWIRISIKINCSKKLEKQIRKYAIKLYKQLYGDFSMLHNNWFT